MTERNKMFIFRLVALLICAAISCAVFYVPSGANVSATENSELRGVWVASVFNLDYPSNPTTNSETLKAELTEILDNCKDMGFNAVFFQVRPSGDALYKSSIFPWSRYLTGTQGMAPDNGFDPLTFAVDEAHARGLELHAWLNPYRITASATENDKLSPDNPAVLNPNLVILADDGKMYYNPGDSKTIELIVSGAEEIVKNYAVDGIHLDDYFYPSAGFNDDTAYSFHKDEYADKASWRRANVDNLIKTMDERLHAVRSDIQFGVSPSGIWANASEMPEGSNTAGRSSYSALYADTRGWVKNGWVDYIMPQIYWNIGFEIADYATLCDWWSDVARDTDVKLYIGEAAYKTIEDTLPAWTGSNGTNELLTHIVSGRSNPDIDGYCCFEYGSFMDNPEIYAMIKEANAEPASVPKDDKKEQATLSNDNNQPNKEYKNKFTDMNDYWWAMDAVNELAARGIIKGRSETEFDPDSRITRADNTVLLLRVLNKTAGFSDNFDDVYPDKYYYNEIGMAKALGIATGVGDNLFDPDASIRRQDMATLAYRVLVQEGVLTSIPNTTVLNKFTDKDDIYFYAREAMAACVDKGLISGYGDNTIKPNEYASRVEVALFIYRISQLIG